MDCEGSDNESNFGRWFVWLTVAGAPHASDVMTAASPEQNGQRSCAAAVLWESEPEMPEFHEAAERSARFVMRFD